MCDCLLFLLAAIGAIAIPLNPHREQLLMACEKVNETKSGDQVGISRRSYEGVSLLRE